MGGSAHLCVPANVPMWGWGGALWGQGGGAEPEPGRWGGLPHSAGAGPNSGIGRGRSESGGFATTTGCRKGKTVCVTGVGRGGGGGGLFLKSSCRRRFQSPLGTRP